MNGSSPDHAERIVLRATDVDFSYGPVQVLFGVSLDVRPGEVLGLLGTNGAGKSTVLRVLSGLTPPDAGRLELDGKDITGVPAERLVAMGVVQVPGGKAVFPDLTVLDNLRVGTHLCRTGADQLIERELERFPALRPRLKSLAGSCSGGEQQQLALAKALLLDPKVLCIDELSLGLSPVIVGQLIETLRCLNSSGVTMVIVEQSLNVAAAICDRSVFLEKGQVRFEGHPNELLERSDLARAVFLGAAT